MMKKLFSIIFLASVFCVKAQNEYLAVVSPSNCSYNKFDSIPNVHWILDNSSAIDENHHRYFFIGTPPSQEPSSLYTINTLTGNVISSHEVISTSGDSLLIGLEYDNSSDTLYGILEANSEQSYFVWIDVTNGTIHGISFLPGQSFAIGSSTYDKNHHQYFYHTDSIQYVIDAPTGSIIYSHAVIPENSLIEYDNTTNTLYGIANPTSQQCEFDSITVSTGVAHTIASMPFQSTVGMPVVKAIDEVHGRYICAGGNPVRLYTIDINTGNILYQPIDTLLGNSSNLIEFQYDNVLDTLFALHWGTVDETTTGIKNFNNNTAIKTYPNPANTIIQIAVSNYQGEEIKIYDALGNLVITSRSTQINISSLQKGIYFIRIGNGTQRFVKE